MVDICCVKKFGRLLKLYNVQLKAKSLSPDENSVSSSMWDVFMHTSVYLQICNGFTGASCVG